MQSYILLEADDMSQVLMKLSDHFGRLARNEHSDLLLPGSEVAIDEIEEHDDEDAG
jgi:hypothetical protein